MPWVRFDDQFPIHRKTARLSDAAFRLHVAAIFWSARNLTDGFVSKEDLEDVCTRVRRPMVHVAELILRGVWHLADEACPSEQCSAPHAGDGWVIHDYLEYQPSAGRVRSERQANARRQQDWRDRKAEQRNGASNGVTPPSSNAVSNGVSNAAPSRPVPTRPVVTTTPASAAPTADESVPAKPSKPKRPAIEDPEQWERFWKAYPRKKDKGAAEKAWNRAIRSGIEAKTIIDGLLFYVLDCRVKEPQFIKYPASWLNARGWQDEADPAPPVPRAIGAPSEAAAVQPRPFAEIRHEFAPRNQSEPEQFDFGDAFRMPE